jgi:hypothetical protein
MVRFGLVWFFNSDVLARLGLKAMALAWHLKALAL